jgi:alcohol dehydrogenase class IV
MELININIHLVDLGIRQNDLAKLAENVNGSIENDPASCDKNIIEKIFLTAYNNIF